MIQLFLFEVKKMSKRKLTWVSIFLCTFVMIGISLFNYFQTKEIEQKNMINMQTSIEFTKSALHDLKKEKEIVETTGPSEDTENEDTENVNNSISIYEDMLKDKQAHYENYITNNWRPIYQSMISDLEYIVSLKEAAGYYFEEQVIPFFTLHATLEEMKWNERQNITPYSQQHTPMPPFISTLYEQFSERTLKIWEEKTKRYSSEGFLFLYQLIQNFYIPIIILIGCFIFGNSISLEISKKMKNLDFYYVQPIQKSYVFFIKYATGLLFTILFVLTFLILPLIISLFIDGVGSLQYPVLIYNGATPNPYGDEYTSLNANIDTFHFITLQKYFSQISMLTFLFIIVFYTLYFLLSLFSRNPIVSLIGVSAISFGCMKILSPFNPFVYVNMHKIVTNELATLTFNKSFTVINGLLSLSILSIIMIVLGSILFSKFHNRLIR